MRLSWIINSTTKQPSWDLLHLHPPQDPMKNCLSVRRRCTCRRNKFPTLLSVHWDSISGPSPNQTDFSMKNQFRRALSWKNPFQAIHYLKLHPCMYVGLVAPLWYVGLYDKTDQLLAEATTSTVTSWINGVAFVIRPQFNIYSAERILFWLIADYSLNNTILIECNAICCLDERRRRMDTIGIRLCRSFLTWSFLPLSGTCPLANWIATFLTSLVLTFISPAQNTSH